MRKQIIFLARALSTRNSTQTWLYREANLRAAPILSWKELVLIMNQMKTHLFYQFSSSFKVMTMMIISNSKNKWVDILMKLTLIQQLNAWIVKKLDIKFQTVQMKENDPSAFFVALTLMTASSALKNYVLSVTKSDTKLQTVSLRTFKYVSRATWRAIAPKDVLRFGSQIVLNRKISSINLPKSSRNTWGVWNAVRMVTLNVLYLKIQQSKSWVLALNWVLKITRQINSTTLKVTMTRLNRWCVFKNVRVVG